MTNSMQQMRDGRRHGHGMKTLRFSVQVVAFDAEEENVIYSQEVLCPTRSSFPESFLS